MWLARNKDGLLEIENEQNKENMEEKKTNFVEEIDALCKRYNMAEGVRADFMAEVKEIIKDENRECKLKPFNLEAAKLGKPVCTRDGRKVRIICFDKKCLDEQILIVLVDCGKEESIYFYTTDGKCIDDFSSFDLMMLPEKKEGWMYINKISCMLDNKEIAEKNCPEGYVVAKVELEG